MAIIETRQRKNGSVSFRALIRIKGYPPVSQTFARRTDAKLWAQQTESAMKSGRYQHTPEAKRHTVAEAIERYLLDVLSNRPRNEANIRTHLEWWKEQLGHCLMANLTPPILIEKLQHLARVPGENGKVRSASTVVRYSASFSHLLSVASREWEWIQDNPMRKVRKPSEPRGRVRFLDDVERERLLQACKESGNALLYPAVVIALSTGLRKTELMSLTWQDADLAKGYLIIHETKNGERRGVPIRGLALDLLRALFMRKTTSLFVFPGRSLDAPADLRAAWEQALQKAQILNFRWHDLRHCCASYLVMNQASLAEVAEILGHKTLQMTKRYAHLSEGHKGTVIERMNEKIFG